MSRSTPSLAAVQTFLLDGKGNRALDAELLAGDLPVAHIQPLLGVGQQKFGGVTRGGIRASSTAMESFFNMDLSSCLLFL